jgi:pilus assembly protein TadC
MELEGFWANTFPYLVGCLSVYLFYKLYVWARRMSLAALLFLALIPLISIFPIPPIAFKNLEQNKQQELKKREKEEEDS